MTPKKLFTLFAFAEAVTWTLLIIGMILKYGTRTTDVGVSIGGGIHGFVFLTYCVVTVLVGTSQRWPLGLTVVGLLCAVVPYATIPFEISTRRQGLLEGDWQLGRGGRAPRNWFERLCAWAISHPAAAVVVGLAAVAIVFTVLLLLGPPV
ncbi:DUF3817 domain-containing protein [Brevibacterium daeguense]|uniref:DUF3817 domain-containing protein n=1 Tax=Brevibacterium daeguense TaxID=909936 RepID=A0ABP8EI04_9MICO